MPNPAEPYQTMTPELVMSPLEARAKQFAETAHAGQVRRYTDEPYITHPADVVALVRSVPHTEAMLAASWAHDTVEDTDATHDDVARELGAEVAILVEELTNVSRPQDGNRRQRKALDRAHAAKASPAAKTIRLADLIVNVRTIVERDPTFAKVYLPEKALLLEELREGDPTLWAIASDLLAAFGARAR